MNRIEPLSEISNQSLLLGYNMRVDGHAKDEYYHEIANRILHWGVLKGLQFTGQLTHMPRQVVIDIFRRHIHCTNIIIPHDKVEGEYFDEDLFKI